MNNRTNSCQQIIKPIWRLGPASLMATFLIALSGCGPRLSTSTTIDVAPNDIRTVLVDAVSRDQTITIEAESQTAFNIHIHLSGDEAAVDTAVSLGQESDKILAGQSEVTQATLKAQIPADKEAAIRFQCSGADTATVNYSISN